ncbi:hypothetical protein PAPYR_13375 [Paratrimastix pyriformis]|uniref:Uncharacterized protein n=1 Tax=Paratrimastix pyriformis TaxID=342808 RepID=A0ABQ8U2J2_9EUKA|nr:hypothetical protein PAPYR_13375 [Paratrimastix pyriformis]
MTRCSELFSSVGFTEGISSLSQCNPAFFAALFRHFFHEDAQPTGSSASDSSFNLVEGILNSLQTKLGFNLAHISAQRVTNGEKDDVLCLLEIFMELARIIAGGAGTPLAGTSVSVSSLEDTAHTSMVSTSLASSVDSSGVGLAASSVVSDPGHRHRHHRRVPSETSLAAQPPETRPAPTARASSLLASTLHSSGLRTSSTTTACPPVGAPNMAGVPTTMSVGVPTTMMAGVPATTTPGGKPAMTGVPATTMITAGTPLGQSPLKEGGTPSSQSQSTPTTAVASPPPGPGVVAPSRVIATPESHSSDLLGLTTTDETGALAASTTSARSHSSELLGISGNSGGAAAADGTRGDATANTEATQDGEGSIVGGAMVCCCLGRACKREMEKKRDDPDGTRTHNPQ